MQNSFLDPILGSSTKSSIIECLTEKPLTLKELCSKVEKTTTKPLTYQAIHKATTEMIEAGILQKNEKELMINKEWVEKVENFTSFLKNSQKDNSQDELQMQTHEFETFSDMGKFIIKFLYETPNPKNKPSFCILKHAWPVLGFDKTDYLRFTETLKKAPFFEFISEDSPLDNLFAETFSKMGKKVFCIKKQTSFTDTIVRANCVIQIIYTNDFLKEYHQIFENSRKDKSMQVNDVLINFIVKKTKIIMHIIWNEELADKIINENLAIINKKMGD
jgi:hypothetical protein